MLINFEEIPKSTAGSRRKPKIIAKTGRKTCATNLPPAMQHKTKAYLSRNEAFEGGKHTRPEGDKHTQGPLDINERQSAHSKRLHTHEAAENA